MGGAGVCGHGIMLESISACAGKMLRDGWSIGNRILCLCLWVDNAYSFSDRSGGSIRILECLETHLNAKLPPFPFLKYIKIPSKRDVQRPQKFN